MTLNAPLLFETAVLMLAAFLAGAVVGVVLRWLVARPKPATVVTVAEAKPDAAGPQLVKAPEIAPLPSARPSAAQRLAAAAGKSGAAETAGDMAAVKMPEMALPEMPPIKPSRTPGETVGGRHIDNPEHPQPASLDDVRAELVAQIEAEPGGTAPDSTKPPETASDADIVPAMVAAPDAELAPAAKALDAEAQTSMLAEISDEEADARLPVEERVEPAIEATPVDLIDAPAEIAAEVQHVVETTEADPVPDVVAETPLVEPVYEKETDEAAGEQAPPMAAPVSVPADDEMAAMRAIEGGWSPRRAASARKPADLPEGVSAADLAAADQAVAKSGAAVANVTALASAVLEEIGPTRSSRPSGGFGRPASLAEPRGGTKDDFSQIKGLGPAIESSLNGLGIYHYDQIADWDQKAVVWIENHFGFKGRIGRERWQEQARDLVRGRSRISRPIRR